MKRYCLALDLKDDAELIAEYERYHQPNWIWPEVVASIRAAGVLREQIFRLGTRLVMVIDTEDDFSFEGKAKLDSEEPRVREWEELMNRFQQPLPQAKPGQKWLLMEKIFDV